MENVILTVHLILSLLLIGIVLLQRSEGGGLGLGGGGGAISSRGAANALTKLTWIFAIAFIATSLALTIIAAQKADSVSVVDQPGVEAPAAATQLPAPTGDLTAPPASDAPAAPPPAD